MKTIKIHLFLIGLCLFAVSSFAQKSEMAGMQLLFGDLKLKVDTLKPPVDSLTSKIHALRYEKGPLNMDNMIRFIIQTKQSKDTIRTAAYYDTLLKECQQGKAHQMIDNIMVNLYRQCFTETEVDQLLEFFHTPVGKKMFMDQLLITVTATPAVQNIINETAEKLEKENK
jgi:hypothetical protein